MAKGAVFGKKPFGKPGNLSTKIGSRTKNCKGLSLLFFKKKLCKPWF